MGHEWRQQYEQIGRQFLRICQVQGDYPVYHQLLPEEEAVRAQKRVVVKRVAEHHVSESRRVRDEYVAKQAQGYAMKGGKEMEQVFRKQKTIAEQREVSRAEQKVRDLRALQSQISGLMGKQKARVVQLQQQAKVRKKAELQALRINMREITKARDFKLLMASKIAEGKARCETDANLIKQKGEVEMALANVRNDLESLHETMSKKANLFASSKVRQKAHAREAALNAKEKKLHNEYTSLIMDMKDNEEWFSENNKYEVVEASYERFQYQRVIAGLTGFRDLDAHTSFILPAI